MFLYMYKNMAEREGNTPYQHKHHPHLFLLPTPASSTTSTVPAATLRSDSTMQ